jgi:hypothetical protein
MPFNPDTDALFHPEEVRIEAKRVWLPGGIGWLQSDDVPFDRADRVKAVLVRRQGTDCFMHIFA